MIVLGVHKGHDSSAAIVVDGKVIADVQEERFSRVKHSENAPLKSIEFCLKQAGIKDINEVNYISSSWESTPKDLIPVFDLDVNKVENIAIQLGKSLLGKSTGTFKMKLPIYFPNYKLKDKSKFINNNHHLAHAASAYFTRKNNDKCLIFTVDGAGDEMCTSIWMGEGNKIELLKSYYKEASVGWAYSVVTEGLHWIHGDGEGKTMGLAPYGDFTKCKGVLDKYFPEFKDENLVKKSELGECFFWSESGSTQFHFDESSEVEKLIEQYGRADIAAEAQRKLEENIMNLVFGWAKKTGVKNIAFAGGVMLNVKLNQRIWNNRRDIIVDQHVYPNPGDSGLAVGAALLEYYKHNEFKGYDFNHLYLGPEYSNEEIESILKIRKINYTYVENPSKKAAELLAENKIVAWFQGRMESGPRALGNRSILMSPLKAENKDAINAWVKFREGFRPFCPSLTYESRHDYLKDFKDEFFMITSYDVQDAKRDKIPAVVHVDGTLRPQMVQKETNPRYWELINEFGKITGESIVLNSSFNVMGESIVNNPKEAIRCFYDSGIDALFIGNYYVSK
ncbi:carbamoyltransferase family protein [Ferruginibacter sp.]